MPNQAIFIAATGQNVGKTTLCLGILSGLQKRYSNVGFIKPVGQQHIKVSPDINVDKDAVLFKEHFRLSSDWSDMSPVIIPDGFTRNFLDGQITECSMEDKIKTAFGKIKSNHDFTVVEGTGHMGVGSIVNMGNPKVAALLKLEMIIIASGGLGSAFDELSLNISMCQEYGIKIKGVLLNRVLDSKRDMIQQYFPKALDRLNIPLLGCIPYNEFLSTPCMKDFETLFNANLLSGEQHRYRHFQHTRLVAGSLAAYQAEMAPNELVITPASREDIILATLHKHLEMLDKDGTDFSCGMILTSRHPPHDKIIEQIRKIDIPVLYVPLCSYDAMKSITSYTAKIPSGDTSKIQKAISLVEANIDFDLLTR